MPFLGRTPLPERPAPATPAKTPTLPEDKLFGHATALGLRVFSKVRHHLVFAHSSISDKNCRIYKNYSTPPPAIAAQHFSGYAEGVMLSAYASMIRRIASILR